MSAPTVTERLVGFMRDWAARGLPPDIPHEANRLLVNQLKASVGATGHPAARILHDWAQATGGGSDDAHVLWFGGRLRTEQACMINAALFEVLDFNETYIPTFQHAVSGVLPAVLAQAEAGGNTGREVLIALALGDRGRTRLRAHPYAERLLPGLHSGGDHRRDRGGGGLFTAHGPR